MSARSAFPTELRRVRSDRLDVLRCVPAGAASPGRPLVRAVWSPDGMAGSPLCGVRGPPTRVRDGARGSGVRRTRQAARYRLEGARSPRPRPSRGRPPRRRTAHRSAGGHVGPGESRPGVEARPSPGRAPRARARDTVERAPARAPPAHARRGPATRVLARRPPPERARRLRDVAGAAAPDPPRRRRLHERRNRERGRVGSTPRRRPPGRRRDVRARAPDLAAKT